MKIVLNQKMYSDFSAPVSVYYTGNSPFPDVSSLFSKYSTY